MERLTVDRIEGKFAVCETKDGSFVTIDLVKLPAFTAEGDCLIKDGDTYTIDKEETNRRRDENERLLKEILGN